MIEATIAAVSTPLGEGGIGIVRLSGPDAIEIADRLFDPADRRPLRSAPSHTIHYGHVHAVGRRLDEVLVSILRAPRTYTREDVVEINCHGGIAAARAVLDAALAAGARLAERGEFTKRAFLNGRISLDQAKAVLDIVQAKSALGLEAAVDRLGGRFSDAIAGLRAAIAELLADLDVEIDFPDLDVDIDAVVPRIEALVGRTSELIERGEHGRVIREGLTVAIVGRPNVGKSTLLNALLAEERAIVTPIPGTTRDTIEEEAPLAGIPVRWIDTAGLRATDDPVEMEGVRRTEAAMARADLVLVLIDVGEPPTPEDREILARAWETPALLVENKSDLPRRFRPSPAGRWTAVVAVSAKTGDGIDRLRDAMIDRLTAGEVPTRNSVLLLDAWERDLLRRLRDALARAADAANQARSPDIVAEELRIAYAVAGELQGIDIAESILDAVFSRFCVGK